jgi:hypothetical protein
MKFMAPAVIAAGLAMFPGVARLSSAIFSMVMVFGLLSNAADLEPLAQVEARVKAHVAGPKVPFTVGVWGYNPLVYQQGNDQALPFRMLRMNYMNFLHRPWRSMDNPELWADDMKNRWVPFAETYHIYIAPNVENIAPLDKPFDSNYVTAMTDKYIVPYKDKKNILLWYFKDEPNVTTEKEIFIRTKDIFQKKVPRQPLIVLFQCDWVSADCFGPLDDVLVYDHYPVGSPWGHHSWTSAMESLGKGRPHYITLSAHDFRGGIIFPTIADIRLQSYINIANGADGVNYFIFSYPHSWWYKQELRGMFDAYGNPYGEVWEKLGQMSKDLLPAGQCLLDTKPIPSPWLHGSERQLADRPAIEVKALQGAEVNCTYLVAVNNNVLVPEQPHPLKIDPVMARMKNVYSLYSFTKISKKESDGALTFQLHLDAGDGEILLLANEKTFKKVSNKIRMFRYENELVRYRIVRQDADAWKIVAPKADGQIKLADEAAKKQDFATAEKLAISALAELQKVMNLCSSYVKATRQFSELQNRFGQVERKLERLSDPFVLAPHQRLDFKRDHYQPFVKYHEQASQQLPKMWECYRVADAMAVDVWYGKIDPQLTTLENGVLDLQAGGCGNPNQN